MKFKILKNSLNGKLQNILINPLTARKNSEFEKVQNSNLEKLTINNLPENNLEEVEKPIPKFISVSKLEFDNADVHGGVTKDTSAKGGLRYTIMNQH